MRARRPTRLLSLLAALALLFATTAYLSHVHHASDGVAGGKYCGLCLQLGGTAGPARRPAVAMGSHPAVVAVVLPAAEPVPVLRVPRAHRSRGPPILTVI